VIRLLPLLLVPLVLAGCTVASVESSPAGCERHKGVLRVVTKEDANGHMVNDFVVCRDGALVDAP
jgi:hypothetical protein